MSWIIAAGVFYFFLKSSGVNTGEYYQRIMKGPEEVLEGRKSIVETQKSLADTQEQTQSIMSSLPVNDTVTVPVHLWGVLDCSFINNKT